MEKDLFSVDDEKHVTILLNAMESVYLPFKYDPFKVGANLLNEEIVENFEIRVIFLVFFLFLVNF